MSGVRIGILGGTFNPIHIGHLLLADTAREALTLDRVLFVPTRQPPHKRVRDLLPGPTRMEIIQLAIRDHPAFVASDIELQRKGPSYSIDTVSILRRQLPQAKLFLLVGEDLLTVRWLAWTELKRLCTVVAVHRPGARPGSRQRQAGTRSRQGIKWLPMPQVEIASSEIRKRLKAGRSIRYLVPRPVERYLWQHRLFGAYAPGTRYRTGLR